MKRTESLLAIVGLLSVSTAGAWEANVTDILHHYNYMAVYLSPDPGPSTCSVGSPYLILVDDSTASKQRVALIMLALATGQKVAGYPDPCDTAIWGQSRPTIQRLVVRNSQ
jgi:hypothetical protein